MNWVCFRKQLPTHGGVSSKLICLLINVVTLISCFYVEAGMVAFVFACIMIHFPSKPKHPPSITSTMERTAFLPSLLSICTNPQVWIRSVRSKFSLFSLKNSKFRSNFTPNYIQILCLYYFMICRLCYWHLVLPFSMG